MKSGIARSIALAGALILSWQGAGALAAKPGAGAGAGATARSDPRLIGAWRLQSLRIAGGPPIAAGAERDKGAPDGLIIYNRGGAMSAHILMPADPAAGVAGIDSASRHHAYFGTWTADRAAGTIVHHRVANDNPGLPADVVRPYHFAAADILVLTPAGGRGDELTFRRVGP